MDAWSHRLANRLVGNEDGDATLEVTMVGPELAFERGGTIAVAGAPFRLEIEDAAHRSSVKATGVAFDVPANGRVRFRERTAGTRAYLAVAGGFSVPMVLGSRATHLVSGMGGLDGRPLRAGDVLPMGPPRASSVRRSLDSRNLVVAGADGADAPPQGHALVRVLLGPQDDMFEPVAIERLLTQRFVIASTSNRMAYRLDGPVLPVRGPCDLLSDATTMGHIQVPPSGQPILLMADRQTTGGYPKIATVITADLPVAGQLGPGDSMEFRRCDRAEALRALIRQEQRLLRL